MLLPRLPRARKRKLGESDRMSKSNYEEDTELRVEVVWKKL